MAIDQWEQRRRPLRLEKRYEFDDYESLSSFLEQAAELSEQKGLYPDIGFSRKHANFTIHAEEGAEALSELQLEFTELLDQLISSQPD